MIQSRNVGAHRRSGYETSTLTDDLDMRRRHSPTIWITACVVPLLVWMLLPGNVRVAGLCHDDGSYVVLGQSLVERGIYRYDHYPEPVETAKYPPGVPLLVAACLTVTSDLDAALAAMRVVNALFLALGLAAYWGILAREGMARAAPALVFAIGWSASTADFARVCMSEIPYLGISLLTIWQLLRYESAAERPWRHGVVLAGLGFASFAMRSFGIVLVLTVGLHLLLARRRATAARFAISVLPLVAALQVFMSTVSTPAKGFEDVSVYGLPYFRLFLESLDWVGATVLTNSLQAGYCTMQQVLPAMAWIPPTGFVGLSILWFAVLAVFSLVGVGARRESRSARGTPKIRPWHVLVLGSLALVLPWPASVGRFLIPIVPFVLLMVVRGVEALAGPRSILWASLVLCVAAVSQSIGSRVVQHGNAIAFAGRTYDVDGLREFAERLGTHTAGDGAIVACTADSLLGSHTGIQGVWGWTITADEHLYRNPESAWQFHLGLDKWEWVGRELDAARILYLEQTNSEMLGKAYSIMQQTYGTRSPQRVGDDREPLLRELERDAAMVRDHYRRLGVTHAVLLLDQGNLLFEVLLARLVRRLVEEGRASLVPQVSSVSIQVFRIRP
jgi:hypothetical protein